MTKAKQSQYKHSIQNASRQLFVVTVTSSSQDSCGKGLLCL